MNDIERRLVFLVANGIEENLGFIYSLRCVSKEYIKILSYCNRNNITGKTFNQLFKDHQSSPVRVMSTLLRKIEMDKNRRATVLDLR